MFKLENLKKILSFVTVFFLVFSAGPYQALAVGGGNYSLGITSSDFSGLTLTIGGTGGASPFTGQESHQKMTFDWGDGNVETVNASTIPSYVLTNPGNNGSFTINTWTYNHVYATAGLYNITVKLHHQSQTGAEASASVSIITENDPSVCFDGLDNDNDGTVDANDPDCAGVGQNTPPTITLNGVSPVDITVGGTYTELGATTTDAEDTPDPAVVISGDIVNTATIGVYTLIYTTTDTGGLSASTTRTVNVNAAVPVNTTPVITLTGSDPVNLTVGDPAYVDAGATADDAEDGDITGNIVVAGDTVDTDTVGAYVITYNVVDSESLAATEVTRTVNVADVGEILGCMDDSFDNYNPAATVDDGSCANDPVPVPGCMDDSFDNYNPAATVDDGSCANDPAPIIGCMNPEATNYNPLATVADDSCDFGGGVSQDMCSNIPEAQSEIPEGYERSGETECVAIQSTEDTGSTGGNGGGGHGSSGDRQHPPAGGSVGEVLGAFTNNVIANCTPFINSFLKMGAKNDPAEVKALQSFLNEQGIPVPITGIFGPITHNAVKIFQKTHKEKVLLPWKAVGKSDGETPTGYLYKTTKFTINNMMCAGVEATPVLD